MDSAASTLTLGSAAYSGLQEFGRFSARLPPGQQSSAAFLELGGNAMICRDTPPTLQTTRSTHVVCIVHNAAPIFLGRMVQIRGKVVSEYWMAAHQPGASLYPGREGLHKTAIFNLSLCHFATSKNLVQDVMFRHLGFVRKREKKASPTPEIPAGFCQFAQKTFCQSAVLSLSLLELSPF